MMTLSKSLYTRGIQCSKSLWLKKYSPEALSPPDATALARFETGNIVGDLACTLFPNGREIPYREKNFAGMAELTREWMDERLKYIYEVYQLFLSLVNRRSKIDKVEMEHIKFNLHKEAYLWKN